MLANGNAGINWPIGEDLVIIVSGYKLQCLGAFFLEDKNCLEEIWRGGIFRT
jgi:hypothetical protein